MVYMEPGATCSQCGLDNAQYLRDGYLQTFYFQHPKDVCLQHLKERIEKIEKFIEQERNKI